jgi:putative transposase
VARYRLTPTAAQEAVLRKHCAHARFVWNLAVEQQSWWWPGRGHAPGWPEQARQLTEARAESEWLREGSAEVQHQALRDFAQAMRYFFGGTHRRPTWRKAGREEGFRVHGLGRSRGGYGVKRIGRNVGAVQVPKVGWVRFRWTRAIPEAKSYTVTVDPAGRWHVAFAVIPPAIPGPGTGEVVGIDRGVAVSAALSTGEMLTVPALSAGRQVRLKHLQRKLARARRGSNRRAGLKAAIAKLKATEADIRKDWCEKLSTDLATRFDVIRIEDLRVARMTRSGRGTILAPGRNVAQKTGLNRAILRSGWGLLARRLEDKAPGRVEKINPAYTSQRCSACGHVDAKSRKSQALFACTACGFACNADVNAAKNIARGHRVTARGGPELVPMNREPQVALLPA